MRWRSRILMSISPSFLGHPASGDFLLHFGPRLEVSERLVRPRDDRVPGFEAVPEDLDHGLAGDAGADRNEARDAIADREHAGDLLLLAPDRVVDRGQRIVPFRPRALAAL